MGVKMPAHDRKRGSGAWKSVCLLKQAELFERARRSQVDPKKQDTRLEKWARLETEHGKTLKRLADGFLSTEMKNAAIATEVQRLIEGRVYTAAFEALTDINEAADGVVGPIRAVELPVYLREYATMGEIAEEMAVYFGQGCAGVTVRGAGVCAHGEVERKLLGRRAVVGTTLCLVLSIYPCRRAYPFMNTDGTVRPLTTAEARDHPLWRLVSAASIWPNPEDDHQVLMDVVVVIAGVSTEMPAASGAGSSSNDLRKYVVNAGSSGFPSGMAYKGVERLELCGKLMAKPAEDEADIYRTTVLQFDDPKGQLMRHAILDPHPSFRPLEGDTSFCTRFCSGYANGAEACRKRIIAAVEKAEKQPGKTQIAVATLHTEIVAMDVSTKKAGQKGWIKEFLAVLPDHRGRGLAHAVVDAFEDTLPPFSESDPDQGTPMVVQLQACLAATGASFWTGELGEIELGKTRKRGRAYLTSEPGGRRLTTLAGHSQTTHQRLKRAQRRQWTVVNDPKWAVEAMDGTLLARGAVR